MQDQPTPPGGASSGQMERLRWLADAYGCDPTIDAVADQIIRRTQISAGANERGPVLEVVSLITRDEETLDALRSTGDLPASLGAEMETAVARYEPAMPAATLVELALGNVRIVASAADREAGA
jgi:hypothetical protein